MLGFILCVGLSKQQLAETFTNIISKNIKKTDDGFEISLIDSIKLDPIDVKFSIISENKLLIVDKIDILHYTFTLFQGNVKIYPRIKMLDVIATVEAPCDLSDIISASVFCKSTTLKLFHD